MHGHALVLNAVTGAFYASAITEADVIMADGQSLQNVGVIPDETILPSAADLASIRDPVMSRAAEILGDKLPPEKAGKIFQTTFTFWIW